MTRSLIAVTMAAHLAGLFPSGVLYAQTNVIRIDVVEGERALNDARRGLPGKIALVVRDEQDHPASGARVTLTAPYSGPGVTFQGGGRTWSGVTDEQGRVEISGITPNKTEGRFLIKATAAHPSGEASVTISQTNTMAMGVPAKPVDTDERKGKSNKMAFILLGIAGGAAAGIAVGLGGGSSSSSGPVAIVPATSLSINTISIGGPK